MTLSCVKPSEQSFEVERFDFQASNEKLALMTAQQRIEWSLNSLPGHHILTSSFGAQSAVSLHMITQVAPNIPVVLIDTGYLFKETYEFIDQLVEGLKLNLKVFRAKLSPAWQEARFGQLWRQGLKGIEQYNYLNKVEPLENALGALSVNTWFAGLRREQSASRRTIDFIGQQKGRFKVHPIADWNSRDVHQYLTSNRLPYHPLWEQGYVSIGDTHTTRPVTDVATEEETRFFGLKRECGIHDV